MKLHDLPQLAEPRAALRSDHDGPWTRRRIIARAAAIGAGSAVFGRAVAALAAGGPVTAAMIREAEWVSGLDLPEDQRALMVEGVTALLVGFAVGSETLGSIVSPCTRCGATGLRPTFGQVSRHGAMALSCSMDKLGPIARSVEDCALVFAAIHGADGTDPTAVDRPFRWPLGRDPRTLRVGYVEAAFEEDRAKGVEKEAGDLARAEAAREEGLNGPPVAGVHSTGRRRPARNAATRAASASSPPQAKPVN